MVGLVVSGSAEVTFSRREALLFGRVLGVVVAQPVRAFGLDELRFVESSLLDALGSDWSVFNLPLGRAALEACRVLCEVLSRERPAFLAFADFGELARLRRRFAAALERFP